MKASVVCLSLGLICHPLLAFSEAEDAVGNAGTAEAAPAAEPHFAIWEYRVEGNTLLERTAVELALTPFLGPDKSYETVRGAADALSRAYRDAGYPVVNVDIPEQDVVAGVVKLRVVEGKVSRVRVSGSRYFLLSDIKKEVNSLQPSQAIHIPSFRSDINRLNRMSNDLRVTPVLKQGRTPGTVEVDLRVKDHLPLHGSLELNNHSSQNTSSSRLNASISYDNLWQRDHSLSLQYQTSPEKPQEVKVLAGTYILPVIDESSRFAIYGVKSDSEVSTLTDLTVVGNGKIFGTRFVRALGAADRYVHSLSLGFDYKDFNESVNLAGADSDKTPISYTTFTGIYNGTWFAESSTTKLGLSIVQGMRDLLGGGDPVEFNDKRYGSRANFFYIQSSLKHEYRLASDWRFNGRLKFQVADSPLISNEQFSSGGASSVRGYYESEILGDNGINGSLEASTPNMLGDKAELRLRGFVDGAWVQIKDSVVSTYINNVLTTTLSDKESSIASIGVGVDFTFEKSTQVTLDCGYALKEASGVDNGDIRLHGEIRFEF